MPFDARPAPDSDDGVGSCFAGVDRSVHGLLAELTSGQSPVLTAKAWFDWVSHLGMSPGKQLDLALGAGEAASRLWGYTCRAAAGEAEAADAAPGNRRFAHEG